MTRDEVRTRLKKVKEELALYYSPRVENEDSEYDPKIYTARKYDELYSEQDRLLKQLNTFKV
ncbi:hypothetical protein HYX70_05070 [Candidatus Saccharibacteria bacterium]|nr:hypothetical protein [Candidatus Saccharibacteria bacterium]